MCGEKAAAEKLGVEIYGSPPHVRGKAIAQGLPLVPSGITPACAGKRCRLRSWRLRFWDHPRMCGEKEHPQADYGMQEGSPPHVRGKAISNIVEDENLGITPACAGKRFLRRAKARRFWDHPRMCGEKMRFWQQILLHWGSPPHVRGKAKYNKNKNGIYGITPACAGKSWKAPSCIGRIRDHPRMCGEKLPRLQSTENRLGSPPHVRGKV